LRKSQVDERAFHDEAIARLQTEDRRLQNRIDAMYLDKLDRRVDPSIFHSKSPEWSAEQDRLLRDVATHQAANQTYIEEGVQLLELAHRAHELFERQEAGEKRRLLNFLLSNCVWKAGILTAEYRQPFDMLALAREAGGGDEAMSGTKNGQFGNCLPAKDSNRFRPPPRPQQTVRSNDPHDHPQSGSRRIRRPHLASAAVGLVSK
jgi:site-specific DNA recombinase